MIDTRELRINNIVNANINNSSRFITIVGIQKLVAEEALEETDNPRDPYDYKWIPPTIEKQYLSLRKF